MLTFIVPALVLLAAIAMSAVLPGRLPADLNEEHPEMPGYRREWRPDDRSEPEPTQAAE